jgi:NAD(P)H-hydrate epimerase
MLRRTVKSSEIAVIDENSSYLGVERKLLMENAGAEVARFIIQNEKELSSKVVLVFAGPGNNGGDACVAARHIAPHAKKVIVVLVGSEDKIKTPEARTNLQAVKNMKITIQYFVISSINDISRLSGSTPRPDIIVDGIFGTGIKGEVREPFRSVIEWINNSGATVYSIDVPSGIDPDTGEGALFVRPSFTITLHSRKPFIDVLAQNERGEVVIRPIGAPVESEYIAGPGDLAEVMKHKPSIKEVKLKGGTVNFRRGVRDLAGRLGVSVIESGVEGVEFELISDQALISNAIEKVRENEASIYAYFIDAGESIISLEHAEELKKLAIDIGRIVYECGGPDYITDGKRLKMNWIEPTITNEYYFGSLMLLSSYFISTGADMIHSLAASSFLIRKTIGMVKHFDEFVDRVVSMLKTSE